MIATVKKPNVTNTHNYSSTCTEVGEHIVESYWWWEILDLLFNKQENAPTFEEA